MTFTRLAVSEAIDIAFNLAIVVSISHLYLKLATHEKAMKILLYGMDRYVKGLPELLREIKQSRYNDNN